jgi:hypothetical protein
VGLIREYQHIVGKEIDARGQRLPTRWGNENRVGEPRTGKPDCLPSLVSDYAHTIHAPQKEIVWFARSGHFPFL